MKTIVVTFALLTGCSVILWGVQHFHARAHAMTFEQRAGHMFDSVDRTLKGDRLPLSGLEGGALIDSHSVHALIFRTGETEMPAR
jgi:hypothetical protein